MEKKTISVQIAMLDGKMNKKELKSFFSEFWKIEIDSLKDETLLNNETIKDLNSIRLYQFYAAVESNFDVRIKNIENIKSFKDLLDNISDN